MPRVSQASPASSTPEWPPFRHDPDVRRAKATITEFHPYPKDIRVATRVYLSEFRAKAREVARTTGADGLVVLAAIHAAAIINHIDHGTSLHRVELENDTIVRIANGITGTSDADSEYIRRAASVAAFLLDPVEAEESVRRAIR